MSTNILFPGLFALAPLDNDGQRTMLARELHIAKGFTLIFALCNSAAEREQQMSALANENPDLRIQHFPVREETTHFSYLLREKLQHPAPDAVFLYGLENWIPGDVNPRSIPFLLNLNAARNHFLEDCPCPLVLWMPEYLLDMIQRGAPDFASVRSGLHTFITSEVGKQNIRVTLPSLSSTEYESLSVDERRERVSELEELLFRIRSLPKHQRDVKDEIYVLDQLANSYYVEERYKEAGDLWHDAFTINETVFGSDSPWTADLLSKLATIKTSMKQNDQARILLERALSMLPVDNATTANILSNLAAVQFDLKDYATAQGLLQRALTIMEQVYGTDSLETKDILAGLAVLHVARGQPGMAESLLRRVLDNVERKFGLEHPVTARTSRQLASLYLGLGRYAEAETLARRALKTLERTLGPDHPQTISAMDNYVTILDATGKWSMAAHYRDRAKKMRATYAIP